jgi:hypothetical protein
MTEVFACERCHAEVDPTSPDVVRLIRWDKAEGALDAPEEWLEGPGAFFHRSHTPSPGLRWRLPTDPNG